MGLHPLLMVDMLKSTTVNKNGFTPFAYGRCQSLLQSTRMGLHPLLMVDVKVYYSQREWVLCLHPLLMVDVYHSQQDCVYTLC